MIISIMNTIGSLRRATSTAASIITQNLQMWLGFTSSSWVGGELVVLDKSTNSNNAKLFTGKALSFDGVNDSVDFTSVSLSSEFTIAVWFKVGSGVENWIGNNADGISNSYYNGGNSLKFKINYSSATFSFPSFTDTYSRLVVTRDSSNNVRAYVNGTESTSGSFVKSGVFKFDTLGRERTSYGDVILSDFQYYISKWTSDDVAYDYANPNNLVFNNSASSISVSNLKGYYALSEGSGSIAYDSSEEGNNGAITGATYDDKQPTIPQLGMMDWSKGSNLIEFSEDFANAAWSKSLMTITSGFSSPNGSLSSDKLVGTTGAAIYNSGITSIASTSYTLSFYVKNIDYVNNAIAIRDDSNGAFIDVDISYTATSEWTRITHSFTTPVGCVSLRVYPQRKADGVGSMYVWGVQLEQSSTVGSYIATAGSAAINATLIQNPNDIGKDVLGNSLRLREGGFNLDGSGYAEVADDSTIQVGNTLSLGFWVKPVITSNSAQNLIYKDSWFNGYGVYLINNNKIRLYLDGTQDTSDMTLTIGSWNYVSITYDGSSIKFYLNGSINGSPIANTATVDSSGHNLFIGCNENLGERYDGIIDEILIYDTPLTATEILNNYKIGLSKHS